MDKRIIYKNADGTIAIIIPANCGLTVEQIAQKDVPTGLKYKIVNVSEISSDRTFRDAWTIDDEELTDGVGLITAPSDGTVTTAKLADSSVSLAKLTATGTKDATTFLRGDNTFAAAGLNGWSEDGANNNLLPANASAGIYLGVNSATAANLLDDYEEGTWTPTFNFSSGSVGYASQVGSYTKIGRVVVLQFSIYLSSISSPSGNLSIRSLPFSADSGEEFVSGVAFGIIRAMTGSFPIRAYIGNNSSIINISTNDTNQNYVSAGGSQLTATTIMYGTLTYMTGA